MNRYHYLTALLTIGCTVSGCSSAPRAFTEGQYGDARRQVLLNDKFNENDMQMLAMAMSEKLLACAKIKNASVPPVVLLDKTQNRTEEHIDTNALNQLITTDLVNSGKVQFVDKSDRATAIEEVEYSDSGYVAGKSLVKKGEQLGADYILGGAMATNVQEVGAQKYVYYKLHMRLINSRTTAVECAADKEIRKEYQKRTIAAE